MSHPIFTRAHQLRIKERKLRENLESDTTVIKEQIQHPIVREEESGQNLQARKKEKN